MVKLINVPDDHDQAINPQQETVEFINPNLGERLRLNPLKTYNEVEREAPGLIYAINTAIQSIDHLRKYNPNMPKTDFNVIITPNEDMERLVEVVNENSLYGGNRGSFHYTPQTNTLFLEQEHINQFVSEPLINTLMLMNASLANEATGKVGFMDIPGGVKRKNYIPQGVYLMESLGAVPNAKSGPGFKDNRNAVNATHNFAKLAAILMSAENPHIVISKKDESGVPAPLCLLDRLDIERMFKRISGTELSETIFKCLCSGDLKSVDIEILKPLVDYTKVFKIQALDPFLYAIKLMKTTALSVMDINFKE